MRRRALSLRLDPRSITVGVVALLVALAGGVASMTAGGAIEMGPTEVVATLLGQGDTASEFVLFDLRVPRVLLGIGVGLGLGLGGALLQSLARNPLGSPDILGFTQGAATGALVAILLTDASTAVVAASALFGGMATAALAVVASGGVGGRGVGDLGSLRLVLVGVGLGAVLLAVNTYLVAEAAIRDARGALSWLLGDLGSGGWPQVLVLWPLLIVLGGLALSLGRRTTLLELGDRMAAGLGVPVAGTRIGLLLLAVALASVATAAVGPVAFVALAAPQIARGLCGASTPVPLPSALVGAALVVVADVAAQRLFGQPLPVSVVTGVLGGIYLIGLLVVKRHGVRT